MGDKIKRFFECYIPVTVCNLKCEYCYVTQLKWEYGKMPKFKYSPEQIGQALTQKRLGGTCYFSLCGGGETLLPPEVPLIAKALLAEGHYVNITTNGTYSKGFDAILETFPKEYFRRLHFAFSLHYLELKRLNWLGSFVHNVQRMRAAGCSFVIQLNLYDGYLPVLDEIKEFSLENFGALPQVAVTRMEGSQIDLHTHGGVDEYIFHGKQFESPLFDFTMKNFCVKRREFCYAGSWSFVADLGEGWIKPCYTCGDKVDIFKHPKRSIRFSPIGKNCNYPYCINSSHFLSLGVIPSLFKDVTYASLRDRPKANWYTEEMKAFLNSKMSESNRRYSQLQEYWCSLKRRIEGAVIRRINKVMHKLFNIEAFETDKGFKR